MGTALIAHGDLDGFYSAVLLAREFHDQIDAVIPVEYGKDHSYLKDRYDKFIICDYAENIGGDKTILWVDHHLRQLNGAKNQIIEKAPSCVRLLQKSDVIDDPELTEAIVSNIDMVDSASFPFGEVFEPLDLLFPNPYESELEKYIILNQLLSKNRKTGLFVELIMLNTLSIDQLIYSLNKSHSPKVKKYDMYMRAKQKLVEKIMKSNTMIEDFDGVPVLFTKGLSKNDWVGFDKNIVAYLHQKSPYFIIVFDFAHGINIQVIINPFLRSKREIESPASILETLFDNLRGHEGILNFSFDDKEEAIKSLDLIINNLSRYL